MARFTDEQLKRLKADISLARLIQSQGYQLKREGKDHVMCCPFHDDKTPSLKVSAQKNLFNCFGCGASGTVIDWVMKTQGVSFRHACEILSDDAGVDLGTNMPKHSSVRKLASPINDNADNHTVLRQVIDYYHSCLKQSPEALEYLQKRGLDNPELIDTFHLGFANRTLGLRLPKANRVGGKKIRSQLQDIGIIRTSGHEHFNGSLVIPVVDENGLITEAYGRKILDKLRKGTPYHLYLPNAHQGVFNSSCLQSSEEIILCESLIDALTFWNHGFRNVTTSYGTGGFTDEILQAFKDNNIQRVLIAYDRDKAGNEAAAKLSTKLNAEGFDTYRILFPKNMDANEYALSVQPAAKALGLAIRKAEWMGKAVGKDIGPRNKAEPADDLSINKTTEVKPSSSKAVKGKKLSSLTSSMAFTICDDDDDTTQALPEPPAQVMPKAPEDVEAVVSDHEINISFGQDDKVRAYRVRGLSKNMSYEQLKLNIHVLRGERYYIDTFDLYHARSRNTYIKQAGIELGVDAKVVKKDLGLILCKLETLQEKQITSLLKVDQQITPTLTDKQYIEAMDLLKSPNLLDKITSDLTDAGIVGEEINKLTAYLGCVSRKLDKPLAIIIQSTSAAGKSTLMDAIITMMPEAEKVQYSAMTGQSLFYMGETSLQHKILAIAEEEGAHNASYALKLLQSEGKITIASTGKDETSGNMETKEYSVQGPVMLFMTTTAIDIDEELMNRCLILTVNESRAQTQAIHDMQRSAFTLAGLQANTNKQRLIALHQNAQTLLRPLKVVNPYADQLTFMSNKTRTRRDHMKYLNLINTIALLHQHQRTVKNIESIDGSVEYIEVEISDIAKANTLAHQILGRTLDELPPQTRKLLNHIKTMVERDCAQQGIEACDYRFSRREIREYTAYSDSQLKTHCARLSDLEYLIIHRGGRGQSIVYELCYDGDDNNDQPHMMGLIDVKRLYDTQKSGTKPIKSASSLGQVCPKSGGGLGAGNGVKVNGVNDFETITKKTTEIHAQS